MTMITIIIIVHFIYYLIFLTEIIPFYIFLEINFNIINPLFIKQN